MPVALVAVVVAGLAGLAGAVVVRHEARLSRRVARATGRLERRPPSPGGPLRDRLDALDVAVTTAAARQDDALTSEHLARALAAIPQGVVICDAQGSVVFENDGASAYSRARHGDALVSAAVSDLLQAAVSGAVASTEVELYGPPRRVLQLDAYPLALTEDGATTGGLAVIDDVSERRRLELVRRDFVANISHELKTPVAALALLAETLLDADADEDRDRLARRMLDEAARVSATIDDLLALSSIEADQGAERLPVRLATLVDEVVARATPAAARRGIGIDLDVPPDLTVLGDPRQLASALSNLIDNAVKYSDPGGRVAVDAHAEGGWLTCSVVDEGPGIPVRDHERIFERFYRVDRGRSRETGGTGLGLAIVRHVATNHGGEVTVESREGEGATFTLRLPAADAPTLTRPLNQELAR